MQSFIMNSHEVFIHIHQGCFAGTGAIVRLPQCQWSKPDGYGKISQCITTTKHSKAKTVCIFLGIYCIWELQLNYINMLMLLNINRILGANKFCLIFIVFWCMADIHIDCKMDNNVNRLFVILKWLCLMMRWEYWIRPFCPTSKNPLRANFF